MRGLQPLPRTFHTSSAAIGDRLYVFGGGDKGAEPVKDQQLHVFDTGTSGCLRGCSGNGRIRLLFSRRWQNLRFGFSQIWEHWASAAAARVKGRGGVPLLVTGHWGFGPERAYSSGMRSAAEAGRVLSRSSNG